MRILDELVTEETEIIELEPPKVSEEEKLKVIDLDHSLSTEYIKNMYLYKGIWHYFKEDGKEDAYYYSIPDELVGSRLAKGRNLKTVSFKLARSNHKLGILSPNFKEEKYKYEILSQIINENISYKDPLKLELLRSIPKTEENKKRFNKNLSNFLAIDIHMLQKDRADVNLQFQTDKQTGEFDIAPLYDFASCSNRVGMDGINIPSKITRLDYLHIISLARRNPDFKQALEYIEEEDMASIWTQLCKDYKFNMNSKTYKNILEHYQEKEKNQKKYIKELLSRV